MNLIEKFRELVYANFPEATNMRRLKDPVEVFLELTEKSYIQFNKEIMDMMNTAIVIENKDSIKVETDKVQFMTLVSPPNLYFKVIGIGKRLKDSIRVGDKTICIDTH